MEIVKFERRPFQVDGVRVTEENIQEVAKWCGGEIRRSANDVYIKVQAHRPLNVKQTQAYVGDWILKAQTGFKVYTNQALENSFEALEQTRNVFETHAVVEEILEETNPEALLRQENILPEMPTQSDFFNRQTD